MTPNWRDDNPAVRRRRERVAQPSSIYYGYEFRDFIKQPKSRFVRLHRWYDGCTSDPLFWTILGYGTLAAIFFALLVSI